MFGQLLLQSPSFPIPYRKMAAMASPFHTFFFTILEALFPFFFSPMAVPTVQLLGHHSPHFFESEDKEENGDLPFLAGLHFSVRPCEC